MKHVEKKGSFVAIPKAEHFAELIRGQREDAVQVLCSMPCGQPCVCSCHVSEQAKPRENHRF